MLAGDVGRDHGAIIPSMPEENVELMRRAAALWNEGGVEALISIFPEDAVWYPFREWPESAGEYHGHDGIREIMRGWAESFDEYEVEFEQVRAVGGSVVALGVNSGKIKGSRQRVQQKLGMVGWDFRDGLIGSSRFFLSWDEAVEFAEQRER